jgi:hypothetical protein
MDQFSSRHQEIEQKHRNWREHINRWQDSGLSHSEYCRQHGLTYHQFLYWRKKFVPKTEKPTLSLVEVSLRALDPPPEGNTGVSALRVSFRPDLGIDVLPGFDPPTLQQILIALQDLH